MKNIKVLLSYNFDRSDLDFISFESLFNHKRRDSCFAFVWENDNSIYAIRDHFGQIPLYYRIYTGGRVNFSSSLISLLDSTCSLNFEGLKNYLGFGTPRIVSPFQEIKTIPAGSVIKIDKKTKEISLLYQYIPKPKVYKFKAINKYVDEFEKLFVKAIWKTVKNNEVGLLLSGGIDSGLVGYYLKKQDIKINAYTSSPWGRRGSEIKFSQINQEIIKAENHFISYLEKEDFLSVFRHLFAIYKTIHGTSTSLGIAKLYNDFSIRNEKQIYYAQNADTANFCMPQQNIAYFSKFVPHFCQKFLHKNLSKKDCLENYLNFCSKGLVERNEEFEKKFSPKYFSDLERLTLAGIFIAHSQSDSEVFIDPLIHQNILVSNPFFDVDLVEFFLGVPLKYRLTIRKDSRTKITIDKLIMRKLASKIFPKEVYERKKGFTIPLQKLPAGFLSQLSLKTSDLKVDNLNLEQKFSLKIFLEWCKQLNIKV